MDSDTGLNLLLRGGCVALLMLYALLILRVPARGPAPRLGAAFAVGVAAATLTSAPGFLQAPAFVVATIAALATGSMYTFWLFTRALLDDAFRLRAWHGAVWLAHAAIGLAACGTFGARPPGIALILGLAPVAWALLAAVQSVASWREDLVEGRRRVRALIVAATSLYTLGQFGVALALGMPLRALIDSSTNAAGTALLVLAIGTQVLRMRAEGLFAPAARHDGDTDTDTDSAPAPAIAAPAASEPLNPADRRLLATLQGVMSDERIYRRPSLTIAALAARLAVPEHRLRRLINHGLGHRNFSAFLNGYRLADARARLANPAQAETAVLTIAMDAGFQSIGPFNRAFKAETGRTPSEFRRDALAGSAHG